MIPLEIEIFRTSRPYILLVLNDPIGRHVCVRYKDPVSPYFREDVWLTLRLPILVTAVVLD